MAVFLLRICFSAPVCAGFRCLLFTAEHPWSFRWSSFKHSSEKKTVRFSGKRAKFRQKFAKNWQPHYGSTTLRADLDGVAEVLGHVVEGAGLPRHAPEGPARLGDVEAVGVAPRAREAVHHR